MIKQRTFDEIQQSIRNNINDRDQRVDSKPGTFISDVFVQPEADELASAYIDMKITKSEDLKIYNKIKSIFK